MKVSIIIVVYNEENCIKKCLEAILNQSYTDFELLIIDDSTDNTPSVVSTIQDKRIRYIRGDKRSSVAEARNIGISQAGGEYIFFTDADCVPTRYWVEEGLRIFDEIKCPAVEGRTFYATSKTTIADRVIEKDSRNLYNGTDNIAYRKDLLVAIGGFDESFGIAFEDQDLGYRIKEYGDIVYAENMIVMHQQKTYSAKKLASDSRRAQDAVKFFKKYPGCRNQDLKYGRILYPKKLLMLIFPFLLLFYHGFRSWNDIKLIPYFYLNAIYIRLIIWKAAFKEKIVFF
jgi:glycosyltransferase involved in cell wall biosynthesis